MWVRRAAMQINNLEMTPEEVGKIEAMFKTAMSGFLSTDHVYFHVCDNRLLFYASVNNSVHSSRYSVRL